MQHINKTKKHTWKFKSKSALAEGVELSHDANIFWKRLFVDHLSLDILYHLMCAHHLFSLQCAGSLKLKTHMVCLGGHMLTLEEETWETGLFFNILWAGSVWPALSGSDRSSAFDSTVGRGCFWVINSQPHSPPAALRTTLCVLRGKRKPCFNGNSLFLSRGSSGSVLRSKHLGRLGKLNDTEQRCYRAWRGGLKSTWTESWFSSRRTDNLAGLNSVEPLWGNWVGSLKSLPNMAPKQNQLWFPVTSLVQYVQHEIKGGQENGESASRRSQRHCFAKTDDPFLTLHCDRTRDTWG